MSSRYSESFKSKVIERALTRDKNVRMEDIANEYSVNVSSIDRWIRESKQSLNEPLMTMTKKEKRPQDWTASERLRAIIDCDGLDEKSLSSYCRNKGLYPYHVKQWKEALTTGNTSQELQQSRTQVKQLKQENKSLTRELQRKEKALAETAALLVLKKKAHYLLANSEDN